MFLVLIGSCQAMIVFLQTNKQVNIANKLCPLLLMAFIYIKVSTPECSFKSFGLFPLGQLVLWLSRHLSAEMPVIILHYFCLKLITLQSLPSQFSDYHTCNNLFPCHIVRAIVSWHLNIEFKISSITLLPISLITTWSRSELVQVFTS